MIISSINNVTNVRNYGKIKQNNGKNNFISKNIQKTEYKPSFKAIDPFTIGMLVGIMGDFLLDLRRQNKEIKKLEQQRLNNIEDISNELNITHSEAEEYYDWFLRLAEIPKKENGEEIGLNAIHGYGEEKYKIAVNFITPLIARDFGLYKTPSEIPSGVLLYGDKDCDKKYIAEKTCEHLDYHGIHIENLVLPVDDHKKAAEMITATFEKGKERFEKLGKYTVINFENNIDNFLKDRNISDENTPEINAFLSCDKHGVTWIGTANNKNNTDPEILRKTDIKLPIDTLSANSVKN